MDKLLFLKIYKDISKGNFVSPRGFKILEIENYHFTLQPYVRFANFKERKLNLKYIKTEFKWYLKGKPKDLSIIEHAKIWKDMVNSEKEIPSNYGQYIFGKINQFDYVIDVLIKDPDSRRASISILNYHHITSGNTDLPCTYALNFRIRNNQLKMTVHMRSQDAILGLGNDIPTFSFIQEMIYVSLLEKYPELKMGQYDHFVDSLHVYEKHFQMLKDIIEFEEFEEISIPKILDKSEVDFLKQNRFRYIPEKYKFTNWLNS